MQTTLNISTSTTTMKSIKKISGRGTSSYNAKKSDQKWAGEKYKEYQAKQKMNAADSYVTIGRGTQNIKLADIKNTNTTKHKVTHISTGRGTKRRKL